MYRVADLMTRTLVTLRESDDLTLADDRFREQIGKKACFKRSRLQERIGKCVGGRSSHRRGSPREHER